MTTIHIVYCVNWPEGGTPMLGFRSKERADAFKKRCDDYEKTRPSDFQPGAPVPTVDDAFRSWSDRRNAWLASHPAADYPVYSGPTFDVGELELDES